MFSFTFKKLLPLYPSRVFLEFELANLKELGVPLVSSPIFIERSESPFLTDTWEQLTPSGIDEFYYVDEYVNLHSLWREIYYRAYIKDRNNKIYYTPVTTIQGTLRRHEFLRKRKMLYDEEIVLRKFMGNKIAILKKRNIGARCPKCFDINTGTVLLSNCKTCHGTGFLNPYYTPFVTWSTRTPFNKDLQEQTDTSASQTDYCKLQILDYPSVNQGDIIVFLHLNDRYKVDRVEQTEIRSVTVHQDLTCTKLSRTSAEYNISVDPALFEINGSINL